LAAMGLMKTNFITADYSEEQLNKETVGDYALWHASRMPRAEIEPFHLAVHVRVFVNPTLAAKARQGWGTLIVSGVGETKARVGYRRVNSGFDVRDIQQNLSGVPIRRSTFRHRR
jgi:hypothetical protein